MLLNEKVLIDAKKHLKPNYKENIAKREKYYKIGRAHV